MTDLISREDAIEAVKKEIQDFEANYMHGEDDENFEHDIGFVAGLHRAKTLIRSLPSAEAEWIPCSERLPKTGDSVFVTYSDGEVGIVWSARPKAWVTYIESNNLIYPIAWMPLPEAVQRGW